SLRVAGRLARHPFGKRQMIENIAVRHAMCGDRRLILLTPANIPTMPRSVMHRTVNVLLSVLMSSTIISAPARAQKPTSQAVPAPESSFGFPVGADDKLFDYEQSIAYFRRLAAASNRIKLIDVGKTSFGRTFTVVLISSPE